MIESERAKMAREISPYWEERGYYMMYDHDPFTSPEWNHLIRQQMLELPFKNKPSENGQRANPHHMAGVP